MMNLGAGDVVSMDGDQQEGRALYRIDRVEQGAYQLVEAVRIDAEAYSASDIADEVVSPNHLSRQSPCFRCFWTCL